jgi:hypothetical protein
MSKNTRQTRWARGAHADDRRRGSGGLRKLVALLLLVPTVMVQAAALAPAGAAVVAGFEIDGDTPVNEGGLDWATTGQHATDPVKKDDDSNFTEGSKEFQNPSDWAEGTGTSTDQGDISDVYSHFATYGSDSWAFLGFRRIAESGTMTFMVEFNQRANLPKQTGDSAQFRPNRSVNDLLLRFEQDGNGNFALTHAYKWTQSASGTFADGCFVVPGYAKASAWCPTPTSGAGFAGATGENKLFAEGAVNLSAFDTVGTCRGAYGTMNVRSFAGDSEKSSLLDFVGGIGITVDPTCGQMIINKQDQEGFDVSGATFTITPNPMPGGTGTLTVVEGSTSPAATADPDGTADGTITINPATPGDYTVVETAAPAGYELPPLADRTFSVKVGEKGVGSINVPLTVTDRRYFPPLSIKNTADATKSVTYDWDITKEVVGSDDKDVAEGTSASFDYKVILTAEGPPTFSGHEVHGTVDITNPDTNSAYSMIATLTVTGAGGAACTVPGATDVDGDPSNGLQVEVPTTDLSLTYTCPPGTGAGDTTAKVEWSSSAYPQDPALHPAPVYDASATDGYTFVVPADNRTDETVDVQDAFNKLAIAGAVPATDDLGSFTWDPAWEAGSFPRTVKTWTYSRTVTGQPGTCTTYDNTASVTARDSGTVDDAKESVRVCVGKDLDVTKDANLGYERELLWDVKKGGPGTVFTGQDADGKLRKLVRYTIDLTAKGQKDSAWSLTGTIKLDNPNEWDVIGTISDTVVVDGKTLTCVINAGADAQPGVAGQQVKVLAGAVDQLLSYECPGVQQGDYVGNNTVTFDYSADAHEYPDADDTDEHTEAVKVTGDPSPTNATVTLSDKLDDAPVTLSQTTFDWTTVNAMPDNTQHLTYDVLLGTTEDACTPHTNVVTIDQTKQSDDHTVTVCSPGLTKSVVADYGRKQPWDLTKDVDKTFVEVGPDGVATFNYTVVATPGDPVADGTSSWTGDVTVHNPSPTEQLTVSLTDAPSVPGWTGCSFTAPSTDLVLAGDASATVPYTCTGTGHASGTNKATATFGDQKVDDVVDVEFTARPGITDSKTTLVDDIPNDGMPALQFAVDAAKGANTFTYSRELGAPAGACETYKNTAVLALTGDDLTADKTVRVCEEAPITVDVDGWGKYGVTYPWTIDKVLHDPHSVEVDAATGEATFSYDVVVKAGAKRPAGWWVDGTVEVTNPNTYAEGAITLTDVDVWTDLEGGSDCDPVLPDSLTIARGSTLTVPFECDFTSEPDTSGTVTADVSWDPAGPSSEANVTDVDDVDLEVGKEVDKTIKVYDDKTDPDNPVLLDTLTWSSGLSKTYSYTLTHEGVPGECVDFTNTAWLDLSGEDPEDSTTATVCVEKPLEPEVSGSADLARDYAWSIEKSADATQRTVDGSGNATFTYTVTARAGASKDSGWQAKGSVTITNPNTYSDGDIVADVTAATDLGGGSSCTVTGGDDVEIPASDDGAGTVTLPIACTFSSQPAGSGALSVTATWDPAGEATTASVTDSTPITFTVRSETNKTVEVVDDKTVAGQRVVLDPALTWESGLVKSYTYSLSLKGGAAGACQSYTNTATIDLPVGTDPTASAVVLVCTPVVPVPEVLPEQSFGKAVGKVKASCQGTVKAKLSNRSGETVTYTLRVGKKVHKIKVSSLSKKKFVTKGQARAKVTLKIGSTRLDKLRIPGLCEAPEVLPDTGLRGASS